MKKRKISIIGTISVMIIAIAAMVVVSMGDSYAIDGFRKESFDLNIPEYEGELANIEMKVTGSDTTYGFPIMFADSGDLFNAYNPVFAFSHEGEDASNFSVDTHFEEDGEVYDLGILYLLGHSGLTTNGIVQQLSCNGNYKGFHYRGTYSYGPQDRYRYENYYITDKDSLFTDIVDPEPEPDPDPTNPVPAPSDTYKYLREKRIHILETFATQAAILIYQYEVEPETAIKQELYNALKGDITLSFDGETLFTGNFYNKYLKNVIAEAKTMSEKDIVVDLNLNSNSFTLKDGNYITGDLAVTTAAENNFEGYYVDVLGIDGAYVTNEKGEEVEYGTAFGPNSKFRVVIPSKNVTAKDHKLYVMVDGFYDVDLVNATFYTDGNGNNLVGLSDYYYHNSTLRTLEVVSVPNTAFADNALVYIIGIIVLSLGAGVIGMNALQLRKNNE